MSKILFRFDCGVPGIERATSTTCRSNGCRDRTIDTRASNTDAPIDWDRKKARKNDTNCSLLSDDRKSAMARDNKLLVSPGDGAGVAGCPPSSPGSVRSAGGGDHGLLGGDAVGGHGKLVCEPGTGGGVTAGRENNPNVGINAVAKGGLGNTGTRVTGPSWPPFWGLLGETQPKNRSQGKATVVVASGWRGWKYPPVTYCQ